MNYDDYMKSVEWEEKRQLRLRMDGFRCFKCGTAVNLQVHHITYERLGQEKMGDLVTLCKKCHKRLHEPKENKPQKEIAPLVRAAALLGFSPDAATLLGLYYKKIERIAEYKILNIKDPSAEDLSDLLKKLIEDADALKMAIIEIDPDFKEGLSL